MQRQRKEQGEVNGHDYFVYMLASRRNGALYIGVTGNLLKRASEHREEIVDGHTRKYRIHRLVYYERFGDVHSALRREKRLKKWRREWKVRLIEERNPEWKDLLESAMRPDTEVAESGFPPSRE